MPDYEIDLLVREGSGSRPLNVTDLSTARVSGVAGVDLSGHRIVTVDDDGLFVYADPSEDLGFVGMTTYAVVAGSELEVITLGRVDEPSWTWTPKQRLFVGANGVATPVEPATTSKFFAVALTPTRIHVNPRTSIILA